MQELGAEYKANDVSYHTGDDETWIKMDISAAYPKEAGLMRYTRTVCLKKGKEFILMMTIEVEKIKIDDPALLEVWPSIVYRLLMTFDKKLMISFLPS